MISKATALRIYTSYREIEAANKIKNDIEEAMKSGTEQDALPRDPFGHRRPFEFGVPMSKDSYRCFNVQPTLAISVIIAHIAHEEAALKEANEQARIELSTT